MKGNRGIRRAAAAVVVAVAVFAAVVSYSHIYDLGRTHGQTGTAARLLPLSVDGLLLAASLVLLHEGRSDGGSPALARSMLWLGVTATIGANVAYGAPFGLLGAVISAWPAISFVGTVEMVMGMVSRSRPGAIAPLLAAPPGSAEEAAILAYATSVAGGNPFSERALADRFGIPRSAARRIRTGLAPVGSNGHGPAR